MVKTSLRILINNFRKGIEELKDKFDYSKLGHAFVHFSTKLIFNWEDEEAYHYCSIGMFGHDYGIDGVAELDDKLYIIQGKYSGKRKNFSRTDLQDLQSAVTFLSSPPAGIKNKELLHAIQLYRDYIRMGKEVKLVFLGFGELTKTGKKYLESFQSQLPSKHSLEIYLIDKLLEKYIETFGLYSGKGPDVTLSVKNILTKKDEQGLPRSIVCTISGSEIARIVNLHRDDIFQFNVREFLTMKNPVNKEILHTLEDVEERKLFWYYNLGITAICDKMKIIEKDLRIHANNFRIVNGCQTATILALNYDKTEGVEVMIRIIETSDPELGDKITIRNNTQNPIKGRDLFSQHYTQKVIQEYFHNRKPSIFYERRTGEWINLPKLKKLKFKIRGTRRYRKIRNDDCAKAFLAFSLKMPAEAKMKKKLIFVFKDSGGYYEDIFPENRNPEDLLLSHLILTGIKERIKEFIKNYNSMSPEKRKKFELRRLFLPHSDTQLTAMFGKLLDYKYPKGFNPRDLIDFFEANPNNFSKIYEQLVNILELNIKNAKRVQGEAFNPRNYLVDSKTFKEILEPSLEDFIKLQPQILQLLP